MAPELDVWEAVVRLLLAAGLAGVIGVERELREQEAGLRTHMLVCVGATLFMIVGVYGWAGYRLGNDIGVVVDPSRVASYVVSGIGFLGAGAIIKYGINVRGLTTAASLWVVAAIGVTVGAGMYVIAVAATLLVILALWPLRFAKRQLEARGPRQRRLAVTLDGSASVAPVLAAIEEAGFELGSVEVEEEEDERQVDVVVERGGDAEIGRLLDAVAALEGVRSASVAG